MPKYWGKQIFSLESFPGVGKKQKTEKRKEKERQKVGNNHGQLLITTPPLVAHAKPPGPILCSFNPLMFNDGNIAVIINNGHIKLDTSIQGPLYIFF